MVGVAGVLAVRVGWRGTDGGAALGASGTAGATDADATLRALRAERDAALAELARREAAAARDAASDDAAAADAGDSDGSPDIDGTTPGRPDVLVALREMDERLRALAAPLRQPATPAADRATALTGLLAAMQSADPREAGVAIAIAEGLAFRLDRGEVERIEALFHALPPGHAARPHVAAVVARGLAREASLERFLAALPAVEEPEVRAQVLHALDRSPSAAYRAWWLRLTADEPAFDVLEVAWEADRVVAALTAPSARAVIAALEARLGEPEVADAVLRGRGALAIGLAALHDAAAATAALERLLAREHQPGVRALAEAVLALVRGGEANAAALERAWRVHRRRLRE